MGGTLGAGIGITDGGVIGHTRGAHIGLSSVVLVHMACTVPLTHMHSHSALPMTGASPAKRAVAVNISERFMYLPLGLPRPL